MTDGHPMRLAAVRLFVTDMDRACTFYNEILGWTLKAAAGNYAVFAAGGADVIVEAADPEDPEEAALIGRFAGISFQVDDIQHAYRMLSQSGVRFDGAPQTQTWGGTLAHFFDPDGNTLTLVA